MVDANSNSWVITSKFTGDYDWYLFHGHATVPPGDIEDDSFLSAQTRLTRNTFQEPGLRFPGIQPIVTTTLATQLSSVTTARFLPIHQQQLYCLPFQLRKRPKLWRDLDVLDLEDVFERADRRFLPPPPTPPVEDVRRVRARLPLDDFSEWRELDVVPPGESQDDEFEPWLVPRDTDVLQRHGIMACGSAWFVADAAMDVLRPHLPKTCFHVCRLSEIVRKRPPRRR